MTRFQSVTDQELQAEALLQKKFATQERISNRIQHQARLFSIGNRVLKAGAELCGQLTDTERTCDYTLELKDGDELNAYSDGEKIFITGAMMDFTKNDNELALVLAHEYAHNLMGHQRAKKTNAIIGAIFGAIIDGLAKTNDSSGSQLGASVGAGAYSQSYELEADYVGLYIVERANFNVREAAAIWRKMSVTHPESIYLATSHPTNPERYIAIEKAIREIDDKKERKLPLVPELKS